MIQLINRFGEMHGFDYLMQVLQMEAGVPDDVAEEFLHNFIAPLPMYHSQWVQEYALRLIPAIMKRHLDAVKDISERKLGSKVLDVETPWERMLKRLHDEVFQPSAKYRKLVLEQIDRMQILSCQ